MPDHIWKSAAIAKSQPFEIAPSAEERATLASALGIVAIRKLGFSGQISPEGDSDLILQARLGATVVQDCIVTQDPVTTRIEEDVLRRYLADMEYPDAEETEMPEDDTAEPLPAEIDLYAVMSEALALALPPWPRAPGVEPLEISVTEPGKAPMTDEDAKPFAGLAELRDKMTKSGKTD